jgi:hypothetical protein
MAIRALLRHRGVTLVSVTENLDETASGRLVEGIHALMAEFYSANSLVAASRSPQGRSPSLSIRSRKGCDFRPTVCDRGTGSSR